MGGRGRGGPGPGRWGDGGGGDGGRGAGAPGFLVRPVAYATGRIGGLAAHAPSHMPPGLKEACGCCAPSHMPRGVEVVPSGAPSHMPRGGLAPRLPRTVAYVTGRAGNLASRAPSHMPRSLDETCGRCAPSHMPRSATGPVSTPVQGPRVAGEPGRTAVRADRTDRPLRTLTRGVPAGTLNAI